MNNSMSANIESGLSPAVFQSLVNSRLYLMDYEIVAERQHELTRFNGIQLGAIDICRHDGFGLHRSVRRHHHIREDKVDDYVVHLPLSGSTHVLQKGVCTSVEPGQFVILATTNPSENVISAASGSDPFSCYQARISGSVMRAHIPEIDKFCHRSLSIQHGSGNMISPLFDLALHEASYLPDNQARQLGTVLIDIVVNSLAEAPEVDAQHQLSLQSKTEQIYAKANLYIESHLSDSELNIKKIAEQCHVSVRTLQCAFAAASKTVTGQILERRLLYCRAALKNPALRDKLVTQIAVTWGFNSPAYFSQAYRERFGVTPSVDRDVPDIALFPCCPKTIP